MPAESDMEADGHTSNNGATGEKDPSSLTTMQPNIPPELQSIESLIEEATVLTRSLTVPDYLPWEAYCDFVNFMVRVYSSRSCSLADDGLGCSRGEDIEIPPRVRTDVRACRTIAGASQVGAERGSRHSAPANLPVRLVEKMLGLRVDAGDNISDSGLPQFR